ncbi:hypothetical protein [Clostridium sp. Marseille-P3244]|uniref:hypothetical protein n=1 Tax=Clostridium sp. Marseille-P3244 TaxID=1871020 RepID=UPI00092FFEE3|nr:hypothetical protein [Clostridium sp. Marseille-P3244]
MKKIWTSSVPGWPKPPGKVRARSFSMQMNRRQPPGSGQRNSSERNRRDWTQRWHGSGCRRRIPVKKKCGSFASWKKIQHSDGRIGGHIRRG